VREEWALALAFGFGLTYNWLLTRAMRANSMYPQLMALWVIGGVLATLAISALVQQQTIRLVFTWQGQPLQLTNAQHAALFELRFLRRAACRWRSGVCGGIGSDYRVASTAPCSWWARRRSSSTSAR
jgi:hypothetical protein